MDAAEAGGSPVLTGRPENLGRDTLPVSRIVLWRGSIGKGKAQETSVETTEDCKQLVLLCAWDEQRGTRGQGR